MRNFHVHCPKYLKKKCKNREIFSDHKISDDMIAYFKPSRIINMNEYNYFKYYLTEKHFVNIMSSDGSVSKEVFYFYSPEERNLQSFDYFFVAQDS
tara:strand:- start:453 stop:740 length:288 start_codon:yes stop_codon:yes gene_type:complete